VQRGSLHHQGAATSRLMIKLVVPDESVTQEEPECHREERESNHEENGDCCLVLPLHERRDEREDHERRRDETGAHQECERSADQLRAAFEPWNVRLEVSPGPIGILDGIQGANTRDDARHLTHHQRAERRYRRQKKAGAIDCAITWVISPSEN
jgi:hypothetical protein